MGILRNSVIFDYRLWILLVPSIAILAIDLPVLMTLAYSLAAMTIVTALAHVTRRILFPYIDMEAVWQRALESSYGAGMVFLGICIQVSSTMIACAIWIAK